MIKRYIIYISLEVYNLERERERERERESGEGGER